MAKHGDKWGNWQYDARKLYLDYVPEDYNIRLQKQGLAGQVFSWVRQVRPKTWASPYDLQDLLRAYKDLFESDAKFQNAFKREIEPRKDRWIAFCNEMAVLIQTSPQGSEWGLRLQAIYDTFRA